MPPTLPHWDWQAKRGTLAGVVRPPMLRMNWSGKDVMLQSVAERGTEKCDFWNPLAELFAPFLAYPRASS